MQSTYTKFCLLLVAIISCGAVHAQTTHKFETGLAIGPVHRYGREAIVQDQLAYLWYSNNFKMPKVGDALPYRDGDSTVTWQSVKVDSTGRFRGPMLSNGYLYLTYEAKAESPAAITIQGNSMFFFNGEPHGGDIYRDGFMHVPVKLKKGTNEILIRCSAFARWQGIQAELTLLKDPVRFHIEDLTLPHVVIGQSKSPLWGAVVVSNATAKPLSGVSVVATVNGKSTVTSIPVIPAMTIRKVGFQFDVTSINSKGAYDCQLQLKQKQNTMAEQRITIDAVEPSEHHSYTFSSAIDGSIQYYSVAPQLNGFKEGSSLFLSVHGAGVQAIGQARAYKPKDWGTLVAPTNRRPRGFNWEDWGRLDAMEVLQLARERFSPDPSRIYLTGHSMGGHGTWYLGATFPDKWAAIAPCAGYPTLTGYGSADGKIPEQGRNAVEKMLLRASNPSNVIELARNYKSFGVYIHHGDSDRVVSVNYARQMRKVLSDFHGDFSYYEYPGGSHWFGDQSVDWPPLFDFFKWHQNKQDSSVRSIDFTTANTAVSSKHRWITILQQEHAMRYSRVNLTRNNADGSISGVTENIKHLKISLRDFKNASKAIVVLDNDTVSYQAGDSVLYLSHDQHWKISKAPDASHKGVVRNGGFKEPFNHRFIFVYSTKGNADENNWSYAKAKYDAEVWYYRANGSVEIVADKDFTLKAYPDRGVILYGNASTNAAWDKLLKDCPIQIKRGAVNVGNKNFTGNDLAAFFMWPRADSKVASVGVIAGTGLPGMLATEPNQYFAGGSGFPDFVIFSTEMYKSGVEGVKATGFYTNDWKIDEKEVEFK